ncbi:hypothetical protein A2U01_0051322, partial [Trifolium medium]|nr:hypothetical protein [Trifolium medium]
IKKVILPDQNVDRVRCCSSSVPVNFVEDPNFCLLVEGFRNDRSWIRRDLQTDGCDLKGQAVWYPVPTDGTTDLT